MEFIRFDCSGKSYFINPERIDLIEIDGDRAIFVFFGGQKVEISKSTDTETYYNVKKFIENKLMEHTKLSIPRKGG